MLEVLPHLRSGKVFSYPIFDCGVMAYRGTRQVAASPLRVVEGAYSFHPALGNYMDVCVFADVDPHTQMERIRKRGGEQTAAVYAEKWIPFEEAYIKTYGIKEMAGLVI
jgi:thymidylate kinase